MTHRHDDGRAMLVFDRASIREVDRLAWDDYAVPGIVLMENAANGLADQAIRMLADVDGQPNALIVCGSGNNGGDGYAAARHLHNRGVRITLGTLGAPAAGTDAAINREVCDHMRLNTRPMREIMQGAGEGYDLIVDAIFGTGLDRQVVDEPASAINWINSSGTPVLAADVPSGMDCDTGRAAGGGACVKASATVTFAGVKVGFLQPHARDLLGEVIVADIGAPRELIERLGRRLNASADPQAPTPNQPRR